ncbi:reStriction-modification enzyme mpuuiii s subunit [Ureaplasma parvum serovar 6 str. ATCC 27818]|uniref:restriction endonuclease subunit S n=1 Tax=Ureaplasma parvum TaxID=134821 RepID=UPI000173BCC8|nr:restriction endonuclease subunit S [Ureaplasma parvum]EDU19278.1 reStriction-modification enzyme mpuuiii s subunit [Ureaplasma parvum serovar 6 str. ATCC 27818]
MSIISSICKIISGSTPDTKNNDLWKKELPFYSPTDLINNVASRYISIKNNNFINGPAVLFSSAATIGNVYFVDKKCWFNQQIKAFITKDPNILSNKYLYYWFLKNREIIKVGANKGSIFSSITTDEFGNMKINLPSIEEQNEIISIIEPIEKVINNIKNVKIKIESLVNKYFDFLYSDLKDSNFKKYILGDLFTINRGQIINSKYIDNNIGPYPVISSNTKNNGIFGYINSYMYDGEFITISADGAYAGTVFLQNGKFSITNVCFILIKNKYIDFKFNNKFVYYILKKEQEINRLKSQVGSSRPAVREYSLKEIKINLPNMEIQEEFSKIVEPLLNLSTKANKIEKILNDSLLKITKKLIV